MDTFNQTANGCYLFNINAYRLRSQSALQEKIMGGYGIPIEGFYTQHDPTKKIKQKPRYRPPPAKPRKIDIFDFSRVTLAVNGQFINGEFIKMKETRTHFYMNSDDIPSTIMLLQITFSEKENITVLDSLKNNGLLYSFCINTVFPELDMMAAKLVAS